MYTYQVKFVRCVDGDTVILDLDLGFSQWRLGQPYRLLRINAPELNTAAGKSSKIALEAYLVGKSLMGQTQKSDKYGRFLIELLANGENTSDWLVANNCAAYHAYK